MTSSSLVGGQAAPGMVAKDPTLPLFLTHNLAPSGGGRPVAPGFAGFSNHALLLSQRRKILNAHQRSLDDSSMSVCDQLIAEQKSFFLPREDYEIGDYFYQENAREFTCTPQPDGSYKLFVNFCLLCNPQGVCARRTQDWTFKADGESELQECATYILGRTETVCGTWATVGDSFECDMTVNGKACSICEYRSCANVPEFDHLLAACTNIPDGDTIDRCVEDYTKSNPHDGVFTIYNDNLVCTESTTDLQNEGQGDESSDAASSAATGLTRLLTFSLVGAWVLSF
jgi:hypothetical protein